MPLKHNVMTTLHGLVTISELFASFNLINTGVVNCLIMCQNGCKVHHSEAKKYKPFLGRGHSPSQDPSPLGRGTTPLPKSHPLGASILDTSALDLSPKTKVLDPPMRDMRHPHSTETAETKMFLSDT